MSGHAELLIEARLQSLVYRKLVLCADDIDIRYRPDPALLAHQLEILPIDLIGSTGGPVGSVLRVPISDFVLRRGLWIVRVIATATVIGLNVLQVVELLAGQLGSPQSISLTITGLTILRESQMCGLTQ
jgi:hypothetical protein